ncbi:hypothetical protein MUK70_23975 [Dyadobacter chenwenxiniae]|uniref:hypothetical protein n=1 Tax=Dyadobacter chenwenxiniae TaxID=2906456 RepID=UPI001FD4DEB4|nr:hypothetical protein [Dyadobacter chenwenxiniae]UON82093.1 hypothetical protein MUK70_23975 [Dyadobacter chenwenxiniae]
MKYILGVGFLAAQVLVSVLTFSYYHFKATSAAIAGATVTGKSAEMLHLASSTANRAINLKLSLSSKMQMWLSAHLNELVVCWLIGAAFLLLRFCWRLDFYRKTEGKSENRNGQRMARAIWCNDCENEHYTVRGIPGDS